MRAANRLTQPGNMLKMRLQLLSGVGGLKSWLIAPKNAHHGRSATAVAPERLFPGTSPAHSSTITSISNEDLHHYEVAPRPAAVQPAAKRRKALHPQPSILPGDITCVPSGPSGSSGSSRMLHCGTAAVGTSRASQLQELQTLLGYRFKNVDLLDQACTHDSTGSQPSYRELAFLGDAVLWLLFAEHASKAYGSTEDPISGLWPAHLSHLLSRASCAATARQWGLDVYLQHSTPQHGVPGHTQHSTLQHGVPGHTQHSTPQHSVPGYPQHQHGSLQQQADSKMQQSYQLCCEAAQSQSSSSTLQVLSSVLGETSTSISTSSGNSSAESTYSTSTNSIDSVYSTSDSTSSSGGSGSSSRRRSRAMHAGVWTSDALAEMFEGVVGALLLDCGSEYETLKQLLLPWVASSLAASKQAATGQAAFNATHPGASSAASAGAAVPPLGTAQHAHVAVHSTPLQGSGGGQQLQDLQDAINTQLQERCGFCFASQQPLTAASQHMLQLMLTGSCCAEAESGKFLGFAILHFAAALQAYSLQHSDRPDGAGDMPWPAQLLGQQPLLQEWVDWGPVSTKPRVQTPGKSYKVHQMSKHAAELTTVRHRAKMLLMLLEGTPWCPADSFLTNSSWKQQKQTLARCLDVLLAAVYVDSSLEAAIGVAGVLVRTTPPTTHEKSWMPAWARQQTRSKAL